jgi:hypothetical protein
MRSSKLAAICGLKVIDAELTQGDAGLRFENGTNLNIYNRFKLSGDEALEGKTVTDVDEGQTEITIKLTGGSNIRIDMRDDAYTGPEAMQLRMPGQPIVVWN